MSLSQAAGGARWSALYRTDSGKQERLALGRPNEVHFAAYTKAVQLSDARTIEIVSRGREAQMSVDHYEQTAGKK